jgi:septal ring factor EnvC (AmiA/AmiB activator)
MFLFSSENFLQAYKRVQYLKQYASYRRKQGIAIGDKTQLLQKLNKTLIEEKTKKISLIEDNRAIQKQLSKERKEQEALIKTLRRKEKSLNTQISKKEKQTTAINKEIDRLIREAILASNKAAGKKGNKTFELTPEARLISANFQANKGRLPWPLEKGVVTQRFGRQRFRHQNTKFTLFDRVNWGQDTIHFICRVNSVLVGKHAVRLVCPWRAVPAVL